jgi:hypothetical protein
MMAAMINATEGQACMADASYQPVQSPFQDNPEVPTLDFSALTRGAGLLHVSSVWREQKAVLNTIDCTHFCYTPWIFDPMWSMLGGAINDRCGTVGLDPKRDNKT